MINRYFNSITSKTIKAHRYDEFTKLIDEQKDDDVVEITIQKVQSKNQKEEWLDVLFTSRLQSIRLPGNDNIEKLLAAMNSSNYFRQLENDEPMRKVRNVWNIDVEG